MVQPAHGSSESGQSGQSGTHNESRSGAGMQSGGNGSTRGQEHESGGMDQVNDQIDAGKTKAAGTLRDVAQMVRERGGSAPVPGMDKAAQFSARQVETGAQYLEEHTPADMWSDLMSFCKAHPAGALFLGFGVGYFVKKLMP